jgi:hypothetical protein
VGHRDLRPTRRRRRKGEEEDRLARRNPYLTRWGKHMKQSESTRATKPKVLTNSCWSTFLPWWTEDWHLHHASQFCRLTKWYDGRRPTTPAQPAASCSICCCSSFTALPVVVAANKQAM